jgi:hypothetical protein
VTSGRVPHATRKSRSGERCLHRRLRHSWPTVPESPRGSRRSVPAGVAQQDGDWTIPAFVPFFGRTTTLD